LRGIEFLEGAAHVVAEHHERWDGTGYPAGLRSTEIALNARIFAVADAFDAIVSTRVYRAGKPYAAAAAELERHAGKQFDPDVIAAFLRIPPADWVKLRARSLQHRRPERIADALTEKLALAAVVSSSNEKLGALSAPKTNHLVHRPSEMRTLRRRRQ